MLSPGRASVLAAARASGIVLPDLSPFLMSEADDDCGHHHDRNNPAGVDDAASSRSSGGQSASAASSGGSSPLSRVHDSVLEAVLARLDARSKCAAAATCRRLAELLSEPRHWRVLALDSDASAPPAAAAAPLPLPPPPPSAAPNAPTTTTAATATATAAASPDSNSPDSRGGGFSACRPLAPQLPPPPPRPAAAARRGLAVARLLARAGGQVDALRLAGAQGARDRERCARFDAGLRRGAALPHTRGLRALALASLLGESCASLALDERASPLGGMTDDLARALAAHCASLSSLEVAFGRYSPPADLFTDEGVAALALGCGGRRAAGCCPLARLALVNCDRLTDRALYAAAAGWGATLRELEIGGYNEHVSDLGLGVLLEATAAAAVAAAAGPAPSDHCRGLRVARLGARLPKVTDITGHALARLCAATLEEAALSSAMTGATLGALASSGNGSSCSSSSSSSDNLPFGGCPRLRRVDASACAPGSVSSESLARLALACPRLEGVRLPPGSGPAARAAAAALLAEAEAEVEVVVVEEEAAADEEEDARGGAAGQRRRRSSSAAAAIASGSGSGDVAEDDDPPTAANGNADNNNTGPWSRPPPPPPAHHPYPHHQPPPKLAALRTARHRPPAPAPAKPAAASFARPAPDPRDLSRSPVFAFLTSEAGGWDAPQRLATRRGDAAAGADAWPAAVAPPPPPPPLRRRRREVELRVAAAGGACYFDVE